MANKTHGTRQKMTFRLPPTTPRNPLVALARQRKAGSHAKSTGAERAAARSALRKKLVDPDE